MATAKMQEFQKLAEFEVSEIKKIEAEYAKVFKAKQNLIEKKSENEMVLQEFNLMEADAVIFKLVGPVLAKQDNNEAKNNVEKRIEFIGKEIERMDKLEVDFQIKVEEKRKSIMKLQQDMQKQMAQAAQAQQVK